MTQLSIHFRQSVVLKTDIWLDLDIVIVILTKNKQLFIYLDVWNKPIIRKIKKFKKKSTIFAFFTSAVVSNNGCANTTRCVCLSKLQKFENNLISSIDNNIIISSIWQQQHHRFNYICNRLPKRRIGAKIARQFVARLNEQFRFFSEREKLQNAREITKSNFVTLFFCFWQAENDK